MAALFYWGVWCTDDKPGAWGAAVKTASTGLVAMMLAPGLPTQWFWLMPLGLALGALGDLFLALRGQRMFLAGMAAFGLGHLAYAGGMLLRSADIGFDGLASPEIAALAVLLGLLASTEVWLAPRTGALRWPVRAYVLLIGLMGAAAIALPQNEGQEKLRIGAALFMASDLMLAMKMFATRDLAWQRLLSLALWPAYWIGQMLIGWGAILFWMSPKG